MFTQHSFQSPHRKVRLSLLCASFLPTLMIVRCRHKQALAQFPVVCVSLTSSLVEDEEQGRPD